MTGSEQTQDAEESRHPAWYQARKDEPDFLSNFELVPPPKTEKEWADYYQAHRDDPDLWGEPVPAPKPARGRPSRNMGARISVRFTPEEMAGIRATAAAEDLTYSEVVRRAVNADCLKAHE